MPSALALITASLLLTIPTALAQFKCDARMYGRPKLEDCASTFLALPDAKAKEPTPKLEVFRRFVEPQFLAPPFSPVHNDIKSQMEQLPKFWRYRSCRMALMATADRAGRVIDPEPVSTWAFIEHETLKVSRNCIRKKLGGGFVFIHDPIGDGALSMYTYAVGSPFEVILNNYMITSQAVHPPDVLGQGVNGSLTWVADNGSVVPPDGKALRLLRSIQ